MSDIAPDDEEVEALRRELERLQALARNERGLLDAVLNHSPHGIIVSDAQGQLTLHNRAAERIWAGSATAKDVVSWGKYRAFHPDGRPYEPGDWSMARCLSEGKTTNAAETHFQRFDDSHGVLLGSAAPIYDDKGVLTGALSVFVDITELVEARKKAQELERRLGQQQAAQTEVELRKAAILEGSLDCIIVIDREGRIADFNRAAEATFQYERDEVLGKEMASLLIPLQYREQHRHGLKRYVETRKGPVIGKRVELSALRRDGSEFPVELSITPIHVGDAIFFTGYLRDITDRRRAEAERVELLAREQRARASLATTLNSIGDAVIATDASGLITFMNPVAESLTRWSLDDAAGKPLRTVFRIVDDRTRKEVESPADRVIRDGVVVGPGNRTVLIARDGTQCAIDDSGAPIRDDAGVLTGVVLVFRDVTAKAKEEDRREFLTDATPALSSVLDVQKTLSTLARLAVPKLADWCAVDMIGDDPSLSIQVAVAHVDPAKLQRAEDLGKRYPPDPHAKTGVPNVLRTGKSEFYPEIPEELLAASAVDAEHLRLLRELRLRSAMVVPLTARGRVLGAITFIFAESGRRYTDEDLLFAEDFARRAAIAVDNARLYESEQNARRNAEVANRAKDDFLATVSHELRTPLNAMLGWTRLLRAGDLPQAKHASALEVIERNAVSQAQLIEDLLDVSRIISGKLRLDVQSVELADIVEQALHSLHLASEAKGIRIAAALDSNAGPFMGDPHRLQQVVWNLLSNAIKFTPKGGRINITVERVDSSLRLSVADNGHGMKAEFLSHAFERFKQADGATTRAYGGLGLGLAISRHIVELHGGSIHVESKGEGHGSTFIVLLPVSPLRRETRGTSSRLTSVVGTMAFEVRPELKGLTVLVVDDEEDSRNLVVAVLERCGCIVAAAQSAADALAKIRTEKPHVLISDIGMPGEDGYDLIRQVRALAHDDGGNIPAAALTAYARAEDRRKALDAGYTMHVPKPVEPAELISVIASLTRFAVQR
jgi:PAS domain S-box-containing protein